MVAGRFRSNSKHPKLKIFQESSGMYNFIAEVELGRCGNEPVQHNGSGLYECELPERNRFPVLQNDIIGIYLPPASQTSFDVYFTTLTTDQINHIYTEDVLSSVSVSSGAMTRNTPQINLGIRIGHPPSPPTTLAIPPLTPPNPWIDTLMPTTTTGLSESFPTILVPTTEPIFTILAPSISSTASLSSLQVTSVVTVADLQTPTTTSTTKFTTLTFTALVTTAAVLIVVILFLLSIGGCLVYKYRHTSTKDPNQNIREVYINEGDRDEDTELTTDSDIICDVQDVKNNDEDGVYQQSVNRDDLGLQEEDDEKVPVPAVSVMNRPPHKRVTGECSIPKHTSHKASVSMDNLIRIQEKSGGRYEMHQQAVSDDMVAALEPAYANIEDHFIVLNQTL